MKFETISVSPSSYSDVIAPGTIELNNSFCSKDSNDSARYKRGSAQLNYQQVLSIMAKLHCVNKDHCLLTNSGVALATLISSSRLFDRILIMKDTYPEMQDAYSRFTMSKVIDTDFNDFKQGDLVCVESINVPDCNPVDIDFLRKARQHGAKICIDNTIPSVYCRRFTDFMPDFIIESMSKFANGTNSSLISFMYCRDERDFKEIKDAKRFLGFYPHAFDLYLTVLGLQTYPLRMKQTAYTTDALLRECLHNYDTQISCIKQAGLIFLRSKQDIDEKIANAVFSTLDVIQTADTFGAPYTVCSIFTDDILRVSIGLEDYEDLIPDIEKLVKFIIK